MTEFTPQGRRIFAIVGVQKSGTTLVRSILNAHSQILVAYDCAFYMRIFDLFSGGAKLPDDIDRIVAKAASAPRYDLLELPEEAVKSHFLALGETQLTYSEIIGHFADCLALQHKPDAQWVGLKNPNGIFHLDRFRQDLAAAPVINVIRDPRGVLASIKKRDAPRGKYIAGHAIWQTRQRFKNMIQAHATSQGRPDYLSVPYEELLQDLEPQCARMLELLGAPFEKAVLNYHKTADKGLIPQRELYQHKMALQAPDSSRIEAFRKELSGNEIAALETLLADELSIYYPRRYTSRLRGAIASLGVLWDKIIKAAPNHLQLGRSSQ